ncbi:MAG: hypothetical protein K2Y10_10355 [Burkholderiaceae bacterium]|nr:hypothetical protein [Burkholderiaceae bacterium]
MVKFFNSTLLLAALVASTTAWASSNESSDRDGRGSDRGNRAQTPAEAIASPQGVSGRPGAGKGILKLNQHVYYAGDTLQLRVVYPRSLAAVWSGDAIGHIVVYVPSGQPVTVPIPASTADQPIQVLDLSNLNTSQFAEGNYQIALVLTAPAGNPLKLGDWYAGFRGLLSVEQFKIKIRTATTSANPSTEVEGDTDGDGFEDTTTGTTSGTGSTGTATGRTTGTGSSTTTTP